MPSQLQERISEIIAEHGCFFAFNNNQFKESAKPETKYASLGQGLYCPFGGVDAFFDAIIKAKADYKASRTATKRLTFVGVDSWNRPVWRHRNQYFGSVHKLFSSHANEAEIRQQIDITDLCYFGNGFGCEPLGTPVPDGYYL